MRTLNIIFGSCGIVGSLGLAACLPLLWRLGVGAVPLCGLGMLAGLVFRCGLPVLVTGLTGTDRAQFKV